MTLDLAKIKSDAEKIAANSDLLLMALPVKDVLGILAEIERVTKKLCVCRDCRGQGEVYSGHNSYQGWNQPPEPEMDVCGTCGGDGVLGSLEDFELLAAERDQLKTENEALRKALCEISGQVDGNIRCTVRDVVNGLPDVQDIYDYCDEIDEIISAALAKERP